MYYYFQFARLVTSFLIGRFGVLCEFSISFRTSLNKHNALSNMIKFATSVRKNRVTLN